jgi:hypothetical protein
MKCNNTKSQAVHLMADCSVLHPLLFLELPGPGSKTISDLSGTVNFPPTFSSLLSPCSSPCPYAFVNLLVLCASLISDLRRYRFSLLFFSSLLSNDLKTFYIYIYIYIHLSLSLSLHLSLSLSLSPSLSLSLSPYLSPSIYLHLSRSLHLPPL